MIPLPTPFRRLGSKKSAFTLIELLVVILIIAVLAALLFPTLGTIQRKANQTTSTSNLHNWYTGFASSVQDHDGDMPTDGSAPFTATDEQAWFNRLPVELKLRPYSEFNVSNRPGVGQKSIWVNPAVPAKDEVGTGGYVFHYGYNDLLRDVNATANSTTGTVPLKLVRIQVPQATILMGEKADPTPNLNVGNVRAYYAGTDPSHDPDGTANFLFCDGHVDTVKRSDFTSDKATDFHFLDEHKTNISWKPFGERDTRD